MKRWTVFIAVFTITSLHCFSKAEKSCEASNRKCFHVAALVPARAGSKGIKDKNLSILGNETLLGKTLKTIHDCGKFDSVWVSTDGQLIAETATKHNARVHWRVPKTATDNATTLSAVEDFLLNCKECDVVAVIQCTSPFLQKHFLSNAYDNMMKNGADCIFSVTRSHDLRWTENKNGFASPLNFNPKKRPRRQDWPGEFVENGMFYFAKRQLILEQKMLQNNRCEILEIPKHLSVEIDTKFDLMLARAIVSLFEQNNEFLQFKMTDER